MSVSFMSRIAIVLIATGLVTGCGNTIRGAGQDTANAVDATQQAGRNVDRAAKH